MEDTKVIIEMLLGMKEQLTDLGYRIYILVSMMDYLVKRMENLVKRMENLEKRLENLEIRMENLEKRVENLEKRVENLEIRVACLEHRMDAVESNMHDFDSKLTAIKLTQENEIRNGIKIIAEGHACLSRKLDEALQAEHEREMMYIRVLHLETEVREIKAQIQ